MTRNCRISQAPGESAEFQSKFEQIVKALNSAYERNKLVRGIRYEYLRELLPGVLASHNVLCKKGTYYHGFCITLHKEMPTPYLISPFVLGGRFDHNNSAKMAYCRDVEPHQKWPCGYENFSDSHNYRTGWEQLVERCLRVAEEKMLPFYLKEVLRYKRPNNHLLSRLEILDEMPEAIAFSEKDHIHVTRIPSTMILGIFRKI